MTLKPRDRKPPDLGPAVRVAEVRVVPADNERGLQTLINGDGLRDWDKDGLLEQDTSTRHMWRGSCATNLCLEFELREPVALGAIQVWNYNAEWQTADGIRKADVAVSPDGTAWETVLRGAEFAEAEGNSDYDEPILLKLNGAAVRKVRFENIVPWNTKGNVGLSKVVFHQAVGPQAGLRSPEDGAAGIGFAKLALEWVPGQGATEHRVYLGLAPESLAPVGTTKQTRLDAPQLKADTAYFWRVDEVQADGRVVTGRVAHFDTTGLVGWWKLDESKGTKARDATGHNFNGAVKGQANWAPEQGRIGGAMEFDGRSTLIDCGNAAEFDFRDAMTVSAWVKVRKFDKPWQAIVTKGDTSWRLQRDGEKGVVTFSMSTTTMAGGGDLRLLSLVSKRSVDDGQWHHLAGVSDGQHAALYLDGELETSADAQPIAQNSEPVMIGFNSEDRKAPFNGWRRCSPVRLWPEPGGGRSFI